MLKIHNYVFVAIILNKRKSTHNHNSLLMAKGKYVKQLALNFKNKLTTRCSKLKAKNINLKNINIWKSIN